jgi:hypothetical protein
VICVQIEHIGFSLEHIGVALEHIGVELEHIRVELERIGVELERISVELELNGNMIEQKTRLRMHIHRFQPGKRDLHGLDEKKLIRINPHPSWIDEAPVPWWQRFHGMLEGDRLHPLGNSKGSGVSYALGTAGTKTLHTTTPASTSPSITPAASTRNFRRCSSPAKM